MQTLHLGNVNRFASGTKSHVSSAATYIKVSDDQA